MKKTLELTKPTLLIAAVLLVGLALTASADAPTCVPAPPGLVGWWAGEGNASDSAGTNNGALHGGMSFVAGEAGQAFNFDGSSRYVEMPASAGLNVGAGTGLTIECWIKPATLAGPQAVAEWNNGAHAGLHLWISQPPPYGSGSGSIYVNLIDSTGAFHTLCSGAGILNTNGFQHVALSYNKASGMTCLYYNGALVALGTLGSFSPQTSVDFYLGHRITGDPAGYFQGLMDEPSLYNRALSAAEIKAIYNADGAGKCLNRGPSCTPPPAGLVNWWRGEGAASDSAGTNNGTLFGGMSFVAGEVGQAFNFDGSSGYVNIPASAGFNVGSNGALTVEGWIKPAALAGAQAVTEWITGEQLGVHLWISQPTPFGGGDGSLYANLVDTAGTFHPLTSAGGILNTNGFQHVALTYDKVSGAACLYYNGGLVATQSLGGFTPQTSLGLYLGARPGDASSLYHGLMDEVSLYNRALSAAEIQTIYNSADAGKCAQPTAPSIVEPPQSQTVNVGAAVKFSVVAAGTEPLSYQWRFNGTNLDGATASSLAWSKAQLTDAGTYSVLVSNRVGTALSSNAVLAVTVPVCAPAASNLVGWWAGEGNANDSLGTNNGTLHGGMSFVAGEVGQAFNFDGSSGYVTIPASASLNVGTNGGLTVEGWIKPASATANQVLAEWNSGGQLGVHLWISQPAPFGGGSGSIYVNLVDTTGAFHTLTTSGGLVNTDGFQHVALTYDKTSGATCLYYNGVLAASQSLGSFTPRTSLVLNLGERPGSASNRYHGLMDEVSLYSRALRAAEIQAIYNADSTGKCPLGVAPTILTQPTNQTVLAGSDATFTATVTGTAPLSYQWRLSGTNIAGATGASLTLSNVQPAQAGIYTLRVTNVCGSAISSNAVLTVNQASGCTTPPAGLVSWWRGEGAAGDATGTNNGTLNGGMSFVAGEAGQAFSFNGSSSYVYMPASASLNVGAGAGLTFECWIKPAALAGPQAVAEWNNGAHAGLHLWISQPPPYGSGSGSIYVNLIDTTGAFHTLCTGAGILNTNGFQHVALSYDKASGMTSLYYNGALVASQALGNFTPQTSVDFYLGHRITGDPAGYFQGLMDEASLYSRALSAAEIQAIYNADGAGKCPLGVAPSIITQPASQTVLAGSTATFTVTAAGTTPLSYQWRVNGTNLAGASSSSLTLSNVQPAQAGSYSVLVTNVVDSVISSNAVLTINSPAQCAPPPTGLVGWWRGENNAADSAGGHNGTLVNGTGFASGEVLHAFSLDGVQNCVTNAVPGLTNIRSTFTMEFWAWPTAARASTPETTSGLAGISSQRYAIFPDHGVPGFGGAGVSVGTNGVSVFEHADVYLPSLLVYNAAIVGWTHIAVVYQNNQPALYINGVLVRTGLVSTQSAHPSTCLGEIGIGYGYYAGLLDEVSIYDRALSPAEIQAICNADGAGKCSPGVAPTITTQPANQTVLAGSNVIFTATAAGTPPLSYQWRLNGTNLAGATGTSLTLSNVQPALAGNYAAQVTNLYGVALSSNATLTVTQTPPCATPPAGLVGWWQGEGAAGDAAGTNNGVLEGGVAFAAGEVGQAFSFNGTNADVRLPASSSLNVGLADGFTIETWINPADVAEGRPLVEWNNGSFGVHLWIAGASPGSLWFDVKDTSLNDHVLSTAAGLLVSNVWQHVAATYTKSNGNAVVYLNGVPRAQANLGVVTPRTIGDLYFGLRPYDGGAGARFAGLTDEISLYNRALSAAEIQAIYNADGGGKCLTGTPPFISAQPAEIKAIVPSGSAGSTMQLEVRGAPSRVYVIQASINLMDWWTIGLSVTDTNGNVEFTDPNAANQPLRFYRTVGQ